MNQIDVMTILLAGSFRYEIYELAMAKALGLLGWSVHKFRWGDYLSDSLLGKIQQKYLWGPSIKRINGALIENCRSLHPHVVFINRGIYITSETIYELKNYTKLVVSYNNDDPFGDYNDKRWRHFVKAIPAYDINFVYREKNIQDYGNAGANNVYLMRSYYLPKLHRPVQLTDEDRKRFQSDVVYIGHCEPDQRIEYIEALIGAEIHIRLFGTYWKRYLPGNLRKKLGNIRPLRGDDYTKALCASKIALCFLSKLNNDSYARRCFEIPACGTLLMSERTDTLKKLYEEDKEAVYFSDSKELIKKVQDLLNDPEKRNAIAEAGRKRCISEGHDVVSRMREWTKIVLQRLNHNG